MYVPPHARQIYHSRPAGVDKIQHIKHDESKASNELNAGKEVLAPAVAALFAAKKKDEDQISVPNAEVLDEQEAGTQCRQA